MATSEPTATPMRRTAEALVAAFNAMDVDAIMALRTADCKRHIFPKSLGHSVQDYTTVARLLHRLKTVFHNFRMSVDDLIEDVGQRKIVLWLHVRADTLVGEYVNEYVWRLQFGDGAQAGLIAEWWEYVDAGMRDFFPKLQQAYTDLERQQQLQQLQQQHTSEPSVPLESKADAGDGV